MTHKIAALDLRNLSKMAYFKESDVFRIRPTFQLGDQYSASFDLFIASLEQLIEWIIPEAITRELYQAQDEANLQAGFCKLASHLPIFKYTMPVKAPCAIAIASITPSDYTAGVGRYIPDMLSRWALPGKQSQIVGGRTLSFEFVDFKGHKFYLAENFIQINDDKELAIINSSLPNLIREIRINILAVYYARYIVSVKSLTWEEKTTMIEENISSLMNSPSKVKDSNIHDEMQQLLFKLSSEEKFHEVKETISQLTHNRPKNFDRDVFYEIRHFMSLFRDKFLANRSARHVSKVIAVLYLFKKLIKQAALRSPEERHVSFKLINTKHYQGSKSRTVCGILITLNLIRDTERFDRRHLLEAINAYIPDAIYVKDSYVNERFDEKIRSYYLEVEKADNQEFTLEEFKALKKNLPQELKSRIENVVHPIFMPRNEEELIRNIIVLSREIKYIRDLPQIIITYEKQLEDKLSFTVVLVRLIKPDNQKPTIEYLKELPPHLQIVFEESKIVGFLQKKYAKEANIFRVYLQKAPYFRKDSSVDLQRARQSVSQELSQVIGEFRDYNGGMIVKQGEVLEALRKLYRDEETRNEFILENFFYSLKPAIMQSVLPPVILKALYQMLEEAFSKKQEGYFVKTQKLEKYLLVALSASFSFKEEVQSIVGKLKIPSSDLTYSYLEVEGIHALGYIIRVSDPKVENQFLKVIYKISELKKSA